MKIGFIGLGNMGQAVAQAVASLDEHELLLSQYNPDKASKVQKVIGGRLASNQVIAKEADVIFLGIKPNLMSTVLRYLKRHIDSNQQAVWISMLAGVEIKQLAAYIPSDQLVRMMPNTPIAIGEGMTTYTSRNDNLKPLFEKLMQNSGQVISVPESQIDTATAIAGAGPAYVYTFIESLIDAGMKNGLSFEQSKLLASQTLIGASQLTLSSDEHPAALKHQVTSPGGSTIAGVAALEENSFRHAVIEAVDATLARTKKLKD